MAINSASRNGLFQRIAKPDAETIKYFKEYFKDSGYGDLLTADKPKKVKAALDKQAGSSGEWALAPLGAALDGDIFYLEGTAVGQSSVLAFKAGFKGEDIVSFETVEV